MTSEGCLNYRHIDCGRDDCECVCHDNAAHLVSDADLREAAGAMQRVAHTRMTESDLAACEARSREEDVPTIPAALMRRMVVELRELTGIEARHSEGHAEQYFEHRARIAFLEGILREFIACDPFPHAGSFPTVSAIRDRARAALQQDIEGSCPTA
jgi:hypothetical protein